MRRRRRIPLLLIAPLLFGLAAPLPGQGGKEFSYDLAKRKALVQERIEAELMGLDALYKTLHTHPELSYEEEKTSARLAKELQDLGFEVTTSIGGHGVVGVFKNGTGPTILIRTDMDALPVTERTGVPYASKI